MTKLLNANFRRLWQSATFWIGIAVACAHTILAVLNNLNYKSVLADGTFTITADSTVFPDTIITVIIMAVLVTMLVGREYTDKTVRNKIIAGHSRLSIYLAHLIVCLSAAAILFVVPMLTVGVGVGSLLLGGFTLPFKAFILPFFAQLLGVFGFTSLFILIIMSVQNRTVAAIAILLLAAVILGISSPVREMLEAPETVEEIVWDETAQDFVSTGETMKNQAYVGGFARVVLEFFYNLLPSAQIEQSSPFNGTKTMTHIPMYAAAFILITTIGGVWIFRKKELK